MDVRLDQLPRWATAILVALAVFAVVVLGPRWVEVQGKYSISDEREKSLIKDVARLQAENDSYRRQVIEWDNRYQADVESQRKENRRLVTAQSQAEHKAMEAEVARSQADQLASKLKKELDELVAKQQTTSYEPMTEQSTTQAETDLNEEQLKRTELQTKYDALELLFLEKAMSLNSGPFTFNGIVYSCDAGKEIEVPGSDGKQYFFDCK